MDNTPEVLIAETPSKKRFLTVVLVVVILGGLGFYASRPLFASYHLKKGIVELSSSVVGNLERADSYLQKSLWWDSSNPLIHYYLARVAFGHGTPMVGYIAWAEADWPRVIEHYEKAMLLGLEKKDAHRAEIALSDTGRAYRKLGNYKKADEIFREHITRYPEQSFVSRYLLASDDFEINNDPDEALQVLLPALEAEDKIDLRMFRVHTLLARLYAYFGNFVKSSEQAKLAISSAPEGEKSHTDLQLAHLLIANNYARKGNMSLAEAEVSKAENLANVPNIHICYLARTYSYGKQYSKAIKTADTALESVIPLRARQVCLQTLYEGYLALENKKEAKKYLVKYLEVTDAFQKTDIFTVREREKVSRALELLSTGN